jgi:hypothetical protein
MPTLDIDKTLLAKAQQLTGLRRKATVLNAGLEALIARESGRPGIGDSGTRPRHLVWHRAEARSQRRPG